MQTIDAEKPYLESKLTDMAPLLHPGGHYDRLCLVYSKKVAFDKVKQSR